MTKMSKEQCDSVVNDIFSYLYSFDNWKNEEEYRECERFYEQFLRPALQKAVDEYQHKEMEFVSNKKIGDIK